MKKLRSPGNDDDNNNDKVSDYFIKPTFINQYWGSYAPQLQAFIYTNTQFFSSPLRDKHCTIIPFFLDMEAEHKEVKS